LKRFNSISIVDVVEKEVKEHSRGFDVAQQPQSPGYIPLKSDTADVLEPVHYTVKRMKSADIINLNSYYKREYDQLKHLYAGLMGELKEKYKINVCCRSIETLWFIFGQLTHFDAIVDEFVRQLVRVRDQLRWYQYKHLFNDSHKEYYESCYQQFTKLRKN
jgi:hypothetical protein